MFVYFAFFLHKFQELRFWFAFLILNKFCNKFSNNFNSKVRRDRQGEYLQLNGHKIWILYFKIINASSLDHHPVITFIDNYGRRFYCKICAVVYLVLTAFCWNKWVLAVFFNAVIDCAMNRMSNCLHFGLQFFFTDS